MIGFVAIPTQCSDDEDEQNAHYNGYCHDTTVNNILSLLPPEKSFARVSISLAPGVTAVFALLYLKKLLK